MLLPAWLLLGMIVLSLSGCSDDSYGGTDTDGKTYVNLTFSAVNRQPGTRAPGFITDNGITDVLTEGNTVSECQIHTVLVAMFDPVGADNERRLRHLFWFADNTSEVSAALSPLSPSSFSSDRLKVLGTLDYNGGTTLSTSSTKGLWPGRYHTIAYGNFLGADMLVSLLGAPDLDVLANMTQDEVEAANVTLADFKTAFSNYFTSPLSGQLSGAQPTVVHVGGEQTSDGAADRGIQSNLMLGGYADDVRTQAENDLEGLGNEINYFQQSAAEVGTLHFPADYEEASPYVPPVINLKRGLAKIRVNITNIDETGEVYDGADTYYLNADSGIVIKNWIPFGPTVQWKDYVNEPLTPPAYNVVGQNGLTAETGYHDLNLTWLLLPHGSAATVGGNSNTYPYCYKKLSLAADGDVDAQPYTYSEELKMPLFYYLTRNDDHYNDSLGSPVYLNLQQNLISPGLRKVESTNPKYRKAYNGELFNCYIAPWSPLFETQNTKPTTICFTLEKRNPDGTKMAGSERTYEIPLFNTDTDPDGLTSNLLDDHAYIDPVKYTPSTILRNYLYEVDVIFMGSAGLKWRIRAYPDDWIDGGEQAIDLK